MSRHSPIKRRLGFGQRGELVHALHLLEGGLASGRCGQHRLSQTQDADLNVQGSGMLGGDLAERKFLVRDTPEHVEAEAALTQCADQGQASDAVRAVAAVSVGGCDRPASRCRGRKRTGSSSPSARCAEPVRRSSEGAAVHDPIFMSPSAGGSSPCSGSHGRNTHDPSGRRPGGSSVCHVRSAERGCRP
jgi:hypothetical protein